MSIHVTKGFGKMDGINSISTSTLQNKFCQMMQNNPEHICKNCYANKYEKMRKNLNRCLISNSSLLSETILPYDELPIINSKYFRFNSFGELINDIHYINLCNIAKKNSGVKFGLWTKRYDIVMKYDKIKNISYVYSNPFINKMTIDKSIINWFNHVFSVYSKKYAVENGIQINCSGKHCITCLTCYNKNTRKFIYELQK